MKIAKQKANALFVDICPDTFNINSELIPNAIQFSHEHGLNPAAIIPVDLFGLPARYRVINEIAKKYNLKVIADAAQAFGASKDRQRVGTFADITTTSFFPAKPLGCYGDGGAIFTNDVLGRCI